MLPDKLSPSLWRSQTCGPLPLHEQVLVTGQDAITMVEKLTAACTARPLRPAVALAGSAARVSLRASATVLFASAPLMRSAAKAAGTSAGGAVRLADAVVYAAAVDTRDATRSSRAVESKATSLAMHLYSDEGTTVSSGQRAAEPAVEPTTPSPADRARPVPAARLSDEQTSSTPSHQR